MQTILIEEGHPLDHLATYFAMIEDSIDSFPCKRLFVRRDDGPHDVIGNGKFACAYFASSILSLTGLISQGIHTTVLHTIEDMLQSGWYQINHFRKGAVIIWGPKVASDGNPHKHIGFYLGEDLAVSTDGVTGVPTKHHVTYGFIDGCPARRIEALFFHEKLRG